MSKERTTPEVTTTTLHTDAKSASLPSAVVVEPAVLLFGRYFKLLKGDPEKIWTFSSLELTRCQPGVIL